MGRKRVLPKGMWDRDGIYYARFRVGGRLVRKRLSSNYAAACKLLNELRARADKADFDLLDNDYALEDLKKQWLRHCEQALRPMTVKRYRENLNQILPRLPGRSVRQVTADVVLTYRHDRLPMGAAARTVNMDRGEPVAASPIKCYQPRTRSLRFTPSAVTTGRCFCRSNFFVAVVWTARWRHPHGP